jgi:hypothetical protein
MDILNHAQEEPGESAECLPRGSVRDILLLSWKTLGAGAARGRVLFVACLLLICGTAVFIGVVPTRVFGHDDFFLLDNGWRVVCGLRPHLDFYSPWGPLTFLIVGLGMVISNASPNAIGYGNAIVGLLVGLWGYRLGRDRLLTAPRVLFGLFLAALVTAPYALGTWPVFSTHAMVYNRYGYALLGLVLVECLQRSEGAEEHAGEMLGGISTGVAMALALFLKASFFAVCVPIVVVSLIFRKPPKRRLYGLAAGFGVVAFAFLAYLRFDILRVAQDLRMAAGARSKAMGIFPSGLVLKFVGQVPSLLILTVLFLYRSSPKKAAGRWFEEYQLQIWGLLVFIADAMLMFSNMQSSGMPLLAVFGIVIASRMISERRGAAAAESLAEKHRYIFLMLLCGMLTLPQFCFDLTGLGYGAIQRAHPSAAKYRVRFSTPRLAALILYDAPIDKRANGGPYTASANEGIELLTRNCGPGDRVLTMDMVNPFPYALGWRPARGGMAAVAHNYLFTDELRPSAAEYFGDATVVMVPKEPALDRCYYDGYYRIYSPAMFERYRLAAESESWWLYKLK